MEAAATQVERHRFRALEQPTMCAAFQVTAFEHPDRVAIRTRGDGVSISWGEYAQRVRSVAGGLAALGVGAGDTVAIMLTNRPEFHIVDAAAMHLGATPFSIYNTYSGDQIAYLLEDAANRVVVTEAVFLGSVLDARGAGVVEHIVVVDGAGEDGTLSLEDVERRGEREFDFEATWRAVEPGDLLTLIYTSGTTGPPKGVQITHSNMIAGGRSFDDVIQFPDGARVVSYLPMAHIAERACSQYLPILFGFSVTCCPDAREVVGYLPEVRPTWFFSVPRIFEKLKSAIEAGIAADEDAERQASVRRALELGLRKVRAEQAGEELEPGLLEEWRRADETILAGIRGMLGLDELRALNVGAAPTPPEVIEFYHALGLPLSELWGMSETTGAGTCNRPGKIKIGTVGPPGPGIEVKLAEDGEVLIRGGVVMKGYRGDPERSREAFDDDGFLRTGDIGEFDEDGYLRIVDRKKELIINAAGKNMSPAYIESKLKTASDLIGQAICIGDARPYNVALITLDPDAATAFAHHHGLDDASPEALAREAAVREEIAAGVERANSQLARVEQIKKFRLLPVEWDAGGDELTPTMKLKRRPIDAKYRDEIAALYS